MNGVDAFAAVADRLDLFADRVRYERVLACRDVADWCRAQDGAGMTATDAFEAVADYCDIAAHAMPILGNYIGFERYVAYGGIAGWCHKAGRDAWDQTYGKESVMDGNGTMDAVDTRLGGVRAAIRGAAADFRPDLDAVYYASTPDGDINLRDLLALAPKGMDAADFERRVSIMYNGDDGQRARMLANWHDPDYMYDLVDEVEDTGYVLDYDLRWCDGRDA